MGQQNLVEGEDGGLGVDGPQVVEVRQSRSRPRSRRHGPAAAEVGAAPRADRKGPGLRGSAAAAGSEWFKRAVKRSKANPITAGAKVKMMFQLQVWFPEISR